MNHHNQPKNAASSLSRRDFIQRSVANTAILSTGLLINNQTSVSADDNTVKPISPGFVGTQYYDQHEQSALMDVLKSGSPFRFWGQDKPRKTQEFEEEFAKYMGVTYSLAVCSGTSALNCAIAGLGIGPGDEVIVPAYSWWSDYTCVINAGALPVFADIDRTFNLDPNDFARKITPRTKAVLAVHLLGGMCDMDAILSTAKQNNVKVIEDCAQCVGGSYKGKKLGSLGDVGIYSFQVNKMITAGEGGAVVTADPMVYERAVRFHDVGIFRSVFSDRVGKSQLQPFPGENYRLNEFSGGVLGAQIRKLDRMIKDQRRSAMMILEGIKDLPEITFRTQPDPAGDTGYCIGIRVKNSEARNKGIQELQKRGIPSGPLSGSVLLPLEESVINKNTRHPNWPSFQSPEGKAIQYGEDSCRQTLDIYNTHLLLRIGPKYTKEDNQRIITAFREVYPMIS